MRFEFVLVVWTWCDVLRVLVFLGWLISVAWSLGCLVVGVLRFARIIWFCVYGLLFSRPGTFLEVGFQVLTSGGLA